MKSKKRRIAELETENEELRGQVQHLSTARDAWENIAVRQKETISGLEGKLSRFSRKRDPETGKFTAPAEA